MSEIRSGTSTSRVLRLDQAGPTLVALVCGRRWKVALMRAILPFSCKTTGSQRSLNGWSWQTLVRAYTMLSEARPFAAVKNGRDHSSTLDRRPRSVEMGKPTERMAANPKMVWNKVLMFFKAKGASADRSR